MRTPCSQRQAVTREQPMRSAIVAGEMAKAESWLAKRSALMQLSKKKSVTKGKIDLASRLPLPMVALVRDPPGRQVASLLPGEG
jgi:hypothetical protein